MAIQDVYQLTIQIETPGNVTDINLGYEVTAGSVGFNTCRAACIKAIANFNAELLACLAVGVFIRRYSMTPITATLEIRGFVDLLNIEGTVTGDSLPANIAAIISLPTNAPASKHNGRIYISGLSEESQDEGALEAGQKTLMDDFAAKLNDTIEPDSPETAVFTPVVISRFVDGAPRVPPIGFAVTTPIAKTDLRQQRRRKTPAFGVG